MKKIICSKCSEEMENTHYEDSDGGMIFPVRFFPTIKSIEKYYEKLDGLTYSMNTGKEAKDVFCKTEMDLTHFGPDDSDEEKQGHTFGKILCWCDN